MPNHPLTQIHSDWFDKTKELKNIPQPCNIFIDRLEYNSNNLPNIYIQVEPNIIFPIEDIIIANHQKYHTILTFNKKILTQCPNSKFYVYGTTILEKTDYETIDIKAKLFKISALAGTKNINNAPGHIFRQLIHYNQHELCNLPIIFFRSSAQLPHIPDFGNNPLIGVNASDKIELFKEFQFSIAIENSKQENYFTEKLLDCLITKTIPIYWGCPNIDEFFDTSGWIILESNTIEELHYKMGLLNEGYYNNYIDTIEKNYTTCFKYTDFYINLNNNK